MIDLSKALFFDIETHRGKNWDERSEAFKKAFINHYYDSESYDTPEDHYSEVAGLYAELSQVICVVFGYINPTTNELQTIAFSGSDEIEVLNNCSKIFSTFQKNGYYLVGHNINGCDIPYMVKRYILNNMDVPDFINSYGIKPWDQVHVDTMDLWKFGDYKRVSLEVICAAMDIPCKTDELGGSNLYQWDISEMDWKLLEHYCTEDVRSNYQMLAHILKYYNTSD